MTTEERRRLEMFERLGEVLGLDVAETLVAQLPPPGEQVATARQLAQLEATMERRFAALRSEMAAGFAAERSATEAGFAAERSATEGGFAVMRSEMEAGFAAERSATESGFAALRSEMQHLFELHEARIAAQGRRDLLMIAVPQFLVLLGIVLSLNL